MPESIAKELVRVLPGRCATQKGSEGLRMEEGPCLEGRSRLTKRWVSEQSVQSLESGPRAVLPLSGALPGGLGQDLPAPGSHPAAEGK